MPIIYCRMVKHVQMSNRYLIKMNQYKSDINLKIDIDDDDTDYTTIQYKIVKIPTIILIENGKIINYINEQITEDKLDTVMII